MPFLFLTYEDITMADIEFADGFFVNEPNERAPDFVKCNISIDRERFIEFLQSKDDEFVNLDVLEAKSTGNWYAKVNNWKPTPQNSPAPEKEKEHGSPASFTNEFDDDVPF